MRRLLYLAALSMVIGIVFAPVALAQSRGPSGADGTYNCEDFDDQGQAQQFFNSAGAGDPHGLDADGDGIACEELPTVTQEGTIPGEGEEVTSTAQYQQYAPQQPMPVEPALLDTGGVTPLLLPAAGLLLGAGLIGLRMIRRS